MRQILELRGLEQQYIDEFFKHDSKDSQKNAIKRFEQLGFPTNNSEDWKFTDISVILSNKFKLATQKDAEIDKILELIQCKEEKNTIVFINGFYSHSKLSSKDIDITLITANHADSDDAFTNLNLAFNLITTSISIKKPIPDPICIINICSEKESMNHPRINIIAQKDSKATVVEIFTGTSNKYFVNSVTDIELKENAEIEHIKLQLEADDALNIAKTNANINRNAKYSSFAISIGSKLSRNILNAVLNEEGASAILNGLYFTNREQQSDHYTLIDHKKANTASTQLYKGILDGNSNAVFVGRVIVQKNAQKISSTQLNKNMLLSKHALINTKPQLEIFADDVKCTHGATVGRLSDEEIFYLQSRGISIETAKMMLTNAFALEIIEKISCKTARDKISNLWRNRCLI